jgi:hypothetical protein
LRVIYIVDLVPETQEKETAMSENRFPAGWDEERVAKLLAFYHEQAGDEALAEDEAGVESGETGMNVPHELVPFVRELIAKRQG